ncbi:TetR/AcrR family transcriptional regulator [Streptacidiphilus sp. PAMC 29251]
MPLDVDASERLDAIARATIAVARERGPRAVTIRTVADHLGGSTTMVTHYVHSRAELLANAVRLAQDVWRVDADEKLGALTGRERILEYVHWWTSNSEDEILRHLWVEMLSMPVPDSTARDTARAEARAEHQRILGVLLADQVSEPERAADILYLLLRGYLISSVEDPQRWPRERVAAATVAATELLIGAG